MISTTRYAFAVLVIVALSACGQSGAIPLAGPNAVNQSARHQHATPWMSPLALHDNLLYVAYAGQGTVAVYQYAGGEQVGAITGLSFPEGLCADAQGNVFIADYGAQKVLEYAHGGTSPIRTLTVTGGYPQACSVDPTTGNVAVTVATLGYSGYVAVWAPDTSGDPHPYVAPNIYYYQSCGYDAAGNLYVNGTPSSGSDVELAGLRHGGYSMVALKPNAAIQGTGSLQWDGKFLAIGDGSGDGVIHRFAVDWQYDLAIETGTVQLSGVFNSVGPGGWWIQGHRIVAGMFGAAVVEYWAYPSGAARKYFQGLAADGYSATVSKGPR